MLESRRDSENRDELLRDQAYGSAVISDALGRLPKLSRIDITFSGNPTQTPFSPDSFRRCWPDLRGYSAQGQPHGVPQLRSLLAGCQHSGGQLTHLSVHNIQWRFLVYGSNSRDNIKFALCRLRVLQFSINTHADGDMDSEKQEYLFNNALADFIQAAPELEALKICFVSHSDDDEGAGFPLWSITHEFTCAALKRVHFGNLRTTQEDLINFFSRHASTLRHISLSTIRLMAGDWVSTLQRAQQTLSLETAEVRGNILDGELHQWYLSRTDEQGERLSKALSDYLIHGGTCPLLDQENTLKPLDLGDVAPLLSFLASGFGTAA